MVTLCSTKQLKSHWAQWIDDTTPQRDDQLAPIATNNAMQHVKAALRHRVFRDNLLANATTSMAAKYRDFEIRAFQVFKGVNDTHPPLGDLPAALQPYLYCLAHPSTKTWTAKFDVQHDLSLAPSYVRPFLPFNLPSATGVSPSVTALVALNDRLADSTTTPSGGVSSGTSVNTRGLTSGETLVKLMGKALNTGPGQSPIRRLTHKKPPASDRLPAKQLDYPPASPPRTADPPAAAERPGPEGVPPPPGYYPPAQRPPPRGGNAPAPDRTYNTIRTRSFSRPTLSDWCLPIEFEQTLQYANLDLPSKAYLFTPREEDDAGLPSRFDRNAFLSGLEGIGFFGHGLALGWLVP